MFIILRKWETIYGGECGGKWRANYSTIAFFQYKETAVPTAGLHFAGAACHAINDFLKHSIPLTRLSGMHYMCPKPWHIHTYITKWTSTQYAGITYDWRYCLWRNDPVLCMTSPHFFWKAVRLSLSTRAKPVSSCGCHEGLTLIISSRPIMRCSLRHGAWQCRQYGEQLTGLSATQVSHYQLLSSTVGAYFHSSLLM